MGIVVFASQIDTGIDILVGDVLQLFIQFKRVISLGFLKQELAPGPLGTFAENHVIWR